MRGKGLCDKLSNLSCLREKVMNIVSTLCSCASGTRNNTLPIQESEMLGTHGLKRQSKFSKKLQIFRKRPERLFHPKTPVVLSADHSLGLRAL